MHQNTRNVKSFFLDQPETNKTTDSHERDKDFLSLPEINRMLDAAKKTRNPARNHLFLLMLFRHGLRVSEAIQLKKNDIDFDRARLWVQRLKNGLSVEQPIEGDELRAIKRYLSTRKDSLPWLFVSEQGTQPVRQTFNYLVKRCANIAGIEGQRITPHTFRHSCGYFMADKGCDLRTMQDYLGHRDPEKTVRYTRIAGSRFEGIFA